MFLVALLLFIFSIILFKYNFLKKRYSFPPGPKGLPIVGNLFQLSQKPQECYTKWREDYGNFFHLKFAKDHVFVMSEPAMIRECFNNNNIFQGRSPKIFTVVLSKGQNGVVLSEGQTWSEQRRFTLRHLRDFGFGKGYMESLIMDEVSDMIASLKEVEGQSIEMHERFTLTVINSLWMIIAGRKFKQNDKDKLDLLFEIDETFAKGLLFLIAPFLLKLAPTLTGYNRAENVGKRLRKMLKEVIREHEATLPTDGNPRDFIDAFLLEIKNTTDANSSFYQKSGLTQLVAGIGDLFFAGSETTSATLNWTILYLSIHQEVQKKIQAEIDSVVGKSRPVSLTDRSSLVYVEATIQEIFRKSSIVVTGVFHSAMEDTTFMGYDIPKNSWLVPNQYVIHHRKDLWGDPEAFRPERFLSLDGKKLVKGENVLAFSVGRRSCIGETLARDEIFLFLTNIFQRFSVTLDPKSRDVGMEPKEGFILHPQDYKVIMKDRLG